MFKSLFATLALTLLVSPFASANDVPSMYPVEGEVTGVKVELGGCPPQAQCMPASHVVLKFTLGACLDTLAPLTSHVEYDNRKITVYVSALAIANPQSPLVRCAAPNFQVRQVFVSGGFVSKDQIEVVFLK